MTGPSDHGQPKAVTVLGATGSIGRSTAELLEHNPGRFRVEALTCGSDVAALAAMARTLKPRFLAVADVTKYQELVDLVAGTGIEVAAGPESLIEAVARPVDLVVAGIVGAAGLPPIMAAVRQGTAVALANKEPLVCTGPLMAAEMKKSGAVLIPTDSEHNAIFQVFDFKHPETIDKVILTASGGPFRTASAAEMKAATAADALNHPIWSMGAKISIDSATMMNKGLEIIEAHYLFPLQESEPGDGIEVIVHPQSVIHSMVRYKDGSVLAQMGTPDMKIPIAYALAWPDRIPSRAERLDLAKVSQLSFEEPDPQRFPALRLAREALKAGGSAPAVLNAANEVGVAAFLENRIGFLDIAGLVEETLTRMPAEPVLDVDAAIALDHQARIVAKETLLKIKRAVG